MIISVGRSAVKSCIEDSFLQQTSPLEHLTDLVNESLAVHGPSLSEAPVLRPTHVDVGVANLVVVSKVTIRAQD